ncbi:MAG: cytoplasmic protein [Rhizobiaceae bacterium]
MDWLAEEINDYRREKEKLTAEAGQRAALFLTCGIDLPEVLSAPAAERDRVMLRLQRLIERERIKGARRHWSYDLNRHIAMKQALDRLREGG